MLVAYACCFSLKCPQLLTTPVDKSSTIMYIDGIHVDLQFEQEKRVTIACHFKFK